MFPFHPTGGPGDGLFPVTRKCNATNRTGAALLDGEYCVFDLTASDGSVDDLTPGSTDATAGDNTSGWNNVIQAAAGNLNGTIFTVHAACQAPTGSVADDGLAEVCYFGFCNGLVITGSGSGSVAIGTELVGTTGGQLDLITADTELVIALGNEAVTTPAAATLGKIILVGQLCGTWAATNYIDA